MQPQIIVLRNGTDTSQGVPQLVSNINACINVIEIVKTTLGPCGMDKLIRTGNKETCITNDGATVLESLEIIHPAAKCMAEIAHAQDIVAGDGTTTASILAGELLQEAKLLVENGYHPRTIIQGMQNACAYAVEVVEKNSFESEIRGAKDFGANQYEKLTKCAATSLNSKLISSEKEYFAKIAVDSVLSIGSQGNPSLIGVKKVPGGSMRDSFLLKGVCFQKTFSYAGFEQQPKFFMNPKVLLLNVELELKAEKDNGEIRIKNPQEYQSIVDAEWFIIMDKLEKCVGVGTNIVLSQKPIGDLATQFFADRNIFCAGRVSSADCERVSHSTGAKMQHTVNDLHTGILGCSDMFEEKQLGSERYNILSGCREANTVTIVLRGGAPQFIDEAERSLNDAILVVKRAIQSGSIVPGGGAIDMQISKYLYEYSKSISSKIRSVIKSFAKALEVIPRTLAENAGFESSMIMSNLRQKHYADAAKNSFGINISDGSIIDTFANFIWEPKIVKIGALNAATEAVCVILGIDETIKMPEVENSQPSGVGQKRTSQMNVSQNGMSGMLKNMPGTRTIKGRGG